MNYYRESCFSWESFWEGWETMTIFLMGLLRRLRVQLRPLQKTFIGVRSISLSILERRCINIILDFDLIQSHKSDLCWFLVELWWWWSSAHAKKSGDVTEFQIGVKVSKSASDQRLIVSTRCLIMCVWVCSSKLGFDLNFVWWDDDNGHDNVV